MSNTAFCKIELFAFTIISKERQVEKEKKKIGSEFGEF